MGLLYCITPAVLSVHGVQLTLSVGTIGCTQRPPVEYLPRLPLATVKFREVGPCHSRRDVTGIGCDFKFGVFGSILAAEADRHVFGKMVGGRGAVASVSRCVPRNRSHNTNIVVSCIIGLPRSTTRNNSEMPPTGL